MTALTRSSLEYDADNRIDLAGIMRTAYDHKALIITITGFFAALGVLYALIATPIYQATAMIQIEPKKPPSPAYRKYRPGRIRCPRRLPRSPC